MIVSSSFAFSKAAARLRWLALAALGVLSSQCQPATTAEQPASAGSPKLETAVTSPIPKFDVESPILRQLALLPPAERNIAPDAMRQYQRLTRRFWLAQYSTDYLVKEAQQGKPNPPVFAYQLATIQGHWRVLHQGFSQVGQLPPTMTSHLARMQQAETLQQAALSQLQADCASERPPHPSPATLAAQQEVKKLLAPLRREPGPMTVHLH